MSIRFPGRAAIDPGAPEAVGVCDRCGQLYNLRDLRYQPVYAGPNMLMTRLRVCTVTCWDEPNPQLKTIRIPPDPWPVSDPRVENFSVDEKNFLNLQKVITKPSMFNDQSSMQCELYKVLATTIEANFNGAASIECITTIPLDISASVEGTSVLNTTLQRGIDIAVAIDGTSALDAELEVVSQVTRTLTDSFTFTATDTYTEVGAALGAADADRIIAVAVSAFNNTSNDGLDSVSIGGVGATLACEIVTAAGADFVFSSIYWTVVPTGTTGNIVLTFTGDQIFGSVGVYRVMGANTVTPITEFATNSVSSGDVSVSQDIPASSATIGTAYIGASTPAGATATWTELTEDTEASINIGVFLNFTSASREDASAAPGTTITAAASSDNASAIKTIAVASFES